MGSPILQRAASSPGQIMHTITTRATTLESSSQAQAEMQFQTGRKTLIPVKHFFDHQQAQSLMGAEAYQLGNTNSHMITEVKQS